MWRCREEIVAYCDDIKSRRVNPEAVEQL